MEAYHTNIRQVLGAAGWPWPEHVLLDEAKAPLSPNTPKAVTYHAQSHYCGFMIGHSLGRIDMSYSYHISVYMR